MIHPWSYCKIFFILLFVFILISRWIITVVIWWEISLQIATLKLSLESVICRNTSRNYVFISTKIIQFVFWLPFWELENVQVYTNNKQTMPCINVGSILQYIKYDLVIVRQWTENAKINLQENLYNMKYIQIKLHEKY
mgnify:CR=1 FL=1